MASGFVMDALHSCNDEWVRRVNYEQSVGGGNIHQACHGQGRKHRGLPASVMGDVKAAWTGVLVIYLFQLRHIPIRKAKNVKPIPFLLKAGS